jgi:hypothetical protein
MPFVVSGGFDGLDVWASGGAGGESFGSGEDGPPVWRAVLAADVSLAAADLAEAESRLTAAQRGLELAERRRATTLEVAREAAAGAANRAFGASPDAAVATDERDLLDSLRQPRPEAGASIWSALAQLHLDGTVETELGGQLVARTLLGWAAGERTVWRAECTDSQAALHRRTVSLAMESRVVLVRRLSLGLRYAARVAATLALPGGPLLALPTVLRYLGSARH